MGQDAESGEVNTTRLAQTQGSDEQHVTRSTVKVQEVISVYLRQLSEITSESLPAVARQFLRIHD